MRQAYDTDITDEQWEILDPLLPPPKQGGRPRRVDMRDIINALFYILSAGCAWRLLPHDLPPWQTVYYYFRQWNQDQTWQGINDYLREGIRLTEAREASPSAACLDSQSVKTGGLLAQDIGFDGGKKIRAENVINSSIRWAYSWSLWSRQPMSQTTMVPEQSWLNSMPNVRGFLVYVAFGLMVAIVAWSS